MKNQYSEQAPNTVGNFFRAMKILFGAFILGVINMGVVIIVLFFLDFLPLTSFSNDYLIYFIIGNLVFLVLMIIVANNVFTNKINSAKSLSKLGDKISKFREAKLIQICLLEASALFSLLALMFYTHIAFVVFSAISLVQMVRLFPRKSNMIEKLDLNYSEQQHLDNPDYLLD